MENILGKGENAGYQPSIFSFSNDAFYPMTDSTVHVAYSFWSANAFNLTNLEFYGMVKSSCKTVVTYKPVQKYESDPYQSLSSIYLDEKKKILCIALKLHSGPCIAGRNMDFKIRTNVNKG